MKTALKPLEGKHVLFTGGTSGIGVEVLVALAKMGGTIFLVGSNKEKARAIIDKIESMTSARSIYQLRGDLSSLSSTASIADQFIALNAPLDLLINNAGIFGLRNRVTTVDDLEATFFINYLSHFLLTMKLLGRLKDAGSGRVINVSSLSYIRVTERNFDRVINNYNAEEYYDYNAQYSLSKLGLVCFSKELSRRVNDASLTVNCLHPGMVLTGMAKNVNPFLMFTLRTFFSIFVEDRCAVRRRLFAPVR